MCETTSSGYELPVDRSSYGAPHQRGKFASKYRIGESSTWSRQAHASEPATGASHACRWDPLPHRHSTLLRLSYVQGASILRDVKIIRLLTF